MGIVSIKNDVKKKFDSIMAKVSSSKINNEINNFQLNASMKTNDIEKCKNHDAAISNSGQGLPQKQKNNNSKQWWDYLGDAYNEYKRNYDEGIKIIGRELGKTDEFKQWKDSGGARQTKKVLESLSGIENILENQQKGLKIIGKEIGKTDWFRRLNDIGAVDIFKSGLSTTGNILNGVGKGIFGVAEGVLDTLTIAGGGLLTPFTGIADLVGYATGNDLGLTNNLWNNQIMPSVKTRIVDGITDSYYASYGKIMNDNTISGFKYKEMGYQVSEMVGNVLAILAGGKLLSGTGMFGKATTIASEENAFTSALISGLSGFGQGAEDAWNESTNIIRGLVYATLTGRLDFLQYLIGGKINGFNILKGSSLLSKLGSAGFRVILDGLDNALEVLFRSAYKSVYNDKTVAENFNEDGGWNSILTQLLIGSAISAGSEGIQFAKPKLINIFQGKNNNDKGLNVIEGSFKTSAVFDGHQRGTFSSDSRYDLMIEYAINISDGYLPRQEVIDSLKRYSKSGNLNTVIPECREYLANVPLNEVKMYLENYDVFHRANFTSSDKYDDLIDRAIIYMDNNHGPGYGFKKLEEFVNTRDYRCISEDVRQGVFSVPFNELEQYVRNYNLNSDIMNGKFSGYNVYFEELRRQGFDYGADQAAIEKLCTYEYNGQQYTYHQATDIVNEAAKNGYTSPLFRKIGYEQYGRLKNKLMSYGFTSNDASVILSSVNDAGACSYASVCGDILEHFQDNPTLFKQTFGFDMYIYDQGVMKLNTSELLLDLFVYANDRGNGGKLLGRKIIGKGCSLHCKSSKIDVFGRKILDTDTKMKCLSNFDTKNTSIIDSYLKGKNINLQYSSNSFAKLDKTKYGIIKRTDFNNIVRNVYDKLRNGKSISMDVGYYPKYGKNTVFHFIDAEDGSIISTLNWAEGNADGGGHSVKVTGLTDNSFIVSSWGKKYYIPFKDFLDGGFATFYEINFRG